MDDKSSKSTNILPASEWFGLDTNYSMILWF